MSPHPPQSDGALERTSIVLVEYLRCYILEVQTDWDRWIPYATFVLNTTQLQPGSLLTSFFSVGNLIYRVYCKRIPLRLDTIMTVMFMNCSPAYNHLTR
jgi:hypothetical protein